MKLFRRDGSEGEGFRELLPVGDLNFICPPGQSVPDYYDGPMLSRPLREKDYKEIAHQLASLLRIARDSGNYNEVGPLPPGTGVLPKD